ncbi:hypothetical protein BDA96_08G100600 [Sorghum bicolor]|uniref:Ubiquitin-like protease family profile domain-containing protein n=1 Tax=Sorghum bicolor TaxID=4558 RepID=A0A921QEX2_SORBI|nr:hypothetical protein BDA96_08G100600 [Sorghum bicolor]
MICFLPINITLCHWYLAVVIPSKGEIQILDFFEKNEQLPTSPIHDTSKWPKGIEVSSWELQHIITNKMQEDGCSCGLWMINFMEYWTGTTLSDHVTQDDINKFRFKLPAILYNSPINEARGLPITPQPNKTSDETNEGVIELNEDDLLFSGSAKLLSKLRWTRKEQVLLNMRSIILLGDDDKTLQDEWVRSTQPHRISLTVSKIINILREGKQMDHDSFNMAIRILANNKYKLLNKPTYHLMDLKFAEVTKFGRDPRCCGKIDILYHEKLKKVLECWPGMQYHIDDCTNILLPYYQDGFYILFILDMQNKIVRIMDPLQDQPCMKGYSQSMVYESMLHNIGRMFNLAMGLSKSKRNYSIYSWKREYPAYVTKVQVNTTDW